MIDLTWLAYVLILSILGFIYIRLLGTGDEEQQP